jgi:VCBS repeat-containing protein
MRQGTLCKVRTAVLLNMMVIIMLNRSSIVQAETNPDPGSIKGTNTSAILSTADVQLTETNEPLRTGGKLSIRDVDSPQTFVAQNNVAGTHGIFNIDSTGAWTYVANSAFDYLKVGQKITDRFTVTSADGRTTRVKVSIKGVNTRATLSAADVQLTETNEPLRTGGTLTIKDIDSPERFVAQKKIGKYGTFRINKAGAWIYVAHSAFDELNVGQSVSDSFTVTSADGTPTTVKVTINGTNDPAILSTADVQLRETNVPLRTRGKLTISDVDSPQSFVAQSKVAGANGIFSIDSSGAWTYVANSAFDELNVGQSVSDSFIVTSADGTPTTVKVTINGTNDPAILGTADVVLTETNEPLRTGGKLTIKDVDNAETFVAQNNVAGTHGIFNIDSSGTWTYVANSALDELNVGQSDVDLFTVTSADGTPTTVKVTVNGTNDPAILSAADIALDETNEPLSTGGKLTITDPDNLETFVAQHNVADTYGVFNIDPAGAWTYVTNSALDELIEDQSVSDSFIVTSADGTPTNVKVTINGTNDPAILSSVDIILDETNAPLSTGGKLTITDADTPQTFEAQSKVVGTNGTFNIDSTGAWTYDAKSAFDYLNVGNHLSDSFTVFSWDGTSTTVKITINGTNDPAILSSPNIDLDEINVPQRAQGKLTIRDVDSPETFVAQSKVVGTIGIFNVDGKGAWTFVANSNFEDLDKGEDVSSTFPVSSADGTTTTVKITIHGKGPSEFRGPYLGVKFGINNSSAIGTTSAPSAKTLAYGLQGGYLQGGYNWDLRTVIVGVGGYFDWNNYTVHSNGVGYGSHAYGVDTKLGLPIGDWLPYVKLGYGYSTGRRNKILRTVAENGTNIAVGVEYNFEPHWSAIAEYKRDSFSNLDRSITIKNRTFTFGFNYYFAVPIAKKKVEVPEAEIIVPAPILAPTALPEAPPTP